MIGVRPRHGQVTETGSAVPLHRQQSKPEAQRRRLSPASCARLSAGCSERVGAAESRTPEAQSQRKPVGFRLFWCCSKVAVKTGLERRPALSACHRPHHGRARTIQQRPETDKIVLAIGVFPFTQSPAQLPTVGCMKAQLSRLVTLVVAYCHNTSQGTAMLRLLLASSRLLTPAIDAHGKGCRSSRPCATPAFPGTKLAASGKAVALAAILQKAARLSSLQFCGEPLVAANHGCCLRTSSRGSIHANLFEAPAILL
ncbi:hypothetical protein M2262_003079 [Pseudomonas sp. BIGb0408]|uniref:Uncharacterized protein n=1 Tax=Phytopseudomonas flavescens TaxID=29435 RepID=A0A7Y9XJ67_9GAMM|nr:hypothetical protein [Pseudomonas sp. BIGb0408]NYH72401.1 hypothetical protein [Pseudomonas flavescens]